MFLKLVVICLVVCLTNAVDSALLAVRSEQFSLSSSVCFRLHTPAVIQFSQNLLEIIPVYIASLFGLDWLHTVSKRKLMAKTNLLKIPPTSGSPNIVNAIIEIPKGSRNKYEIDKATGLLKLDRYLYSSSHYPGDYGFIPQTLAQDDDPLDILVMVNKPTFSGCLIESRVLGLFKMRDKGALDHKILAVPNSDPLFDEYQHISDVPQSYLREVEHFFSTYKQLEGITVNPEGWVDVIEAVETVKQAVDRYAETKVEGVLSRAGSKGVRITHIDHLVITVNDVARSCEFYSETLGMDVRTFAGGRKALHFGKYKINLHPAGKEFEPKAKTPTAGSVDLCFIIEGELDDFINHLKEIGVEIESGPSRRNGAVTELRSIYFRDPDGNLVEVSEQID
jgi:inorganic pyrophosphatase